MIHVKNIKSGKQLFLLRLVQDFQHKRKLWRLGVDWTVWVYIIIPALLLGVYFYVNFWRGNYEWAYYIEESFIPILLLILSMSGTVKAYLKEADILFVWQSEHLVKDLQKYSFAYFCLSTIVSSLVQFTFILPLLVVYLDWQMSDVVNIFLFIVVFRILFTLIKRELNVRLGKWAFRFSMLLVIGISGLLLNFLVPLLTDVILTLIVTIATLIIITLLNQHVSKKKQRFYREVEIEVEKQAKSVQLLFSQLSIIGGPEFLTQKVKNSSRKRPFLFRKSGKIFRDFSAKNSYMEIFMKSLLRNPSWLSSYFRFVGIGSFAIIIVPENYRWAVWLLIVFVIGNLTKTFLKRVLDHPFLSVVAWPEVNEKEIAYNCMIIGLIPGVLILSILYNVLTFALWGIAFGVVTSIILIIVVAQFFSTRVIEKSS